jgi:hypothetical protein
MHKGGVLFLPLDNNVFGSLCGPANILDAVMGMLPRH